jgi:hypothetical protein
LWSDPDKQIQGWGENDRGVSFTFGADIVTSFLKRHDLDLICRAHQVVEDGYEFFAKRQLVTLFSAPNYCGEFDNAGAMMSVDETLMCSFQVPPPSLSSAPLPCLLSLSLSSPYNSFRQRDNRLWGSTNLSPPTTTNRFSNLPTTTKSTLCRMGGGDVW